MAMNILVSVDARMSILDMNTDETRHERIVNDQRCVKFPIDACKKMTHTFSLHIAIKIRRQKRDMLLKVGMYIVHT